ncbi:hypothetical protein D9M71_665680 [compost metagenome]
MVGKSLSGEARQHAPAGHGPEALLSQIHAPRRRPGHLLPGEGLAGRARIQARECVSPAGGRHQPGNLRAARVAAGSAERVAQ